MADSARYLLGKRRIEENYDTGVAAANYAQELERAREQRARQRGEYDEWSGRRNNAWNSTRRGFHSSGGSQRTANSAMDETWRRTWAEHYAANQQRLQQIELQRQQLLRDRNYGLQDLEVTEAERAMEMAQRAAAAAAASSGSGATGVNSQGGEVRMVDPEPEAPPAPSNPYHPYRNWNEWYEAVGRWM